jgi:hypothetical protein
MMAQRSRAFCAPYSALIAQALTKLDMAELMDYKEVVQHLGTRCKSVAVPPL